MIVGCWSRIVRLLASKGQRIATGSCAILADDRRAYTIRFGSGTDGYGIFARCRGTDARSQGIIAGSSPIVIVSICTQVDRFDAVIVDAATTGSASSTAVIDQIDHLFQLGHVDGIRIFLPGCYIGDLAGLLIIMDIFRPVPDIMFRRTYGNGCQSGIPHRIRTSIVIFVIACRVIPTLIVGSPICIGLAAKGNGILDI